MDSSTLAFASPSALSSSSLTSRFHPKSSCQSILGPKRQHSFSTSVTVRRPRYPPLIKCSTTNVNDGRFSRSQSFDPPVDNSNLSARPANVSQTTGQNQIFGRTLNISGRLLLIITSILWAGYTVTIKCLYLLPWALPPVIFNSLRLFMASMIVLPGVINNRRKFIKQQQTKSLNERKKFFESSEVKGGSEIGAWTFIINLFQIIGLKYSTASRASFICQLCSIIVPFGAFLFGLENKIGFNVYIASILSIIGLGLFSLDDFSSPFTFLGEGLLFFAALSGAAFILRCKTHSSQKNISMVIAFKIMTQFIFSLFFILPQVLKYFGSASILNFNLFKFKFLALFTGATPWLLFLNFLLLVYNGVFLSWVSSILHFHGQSKVPASEGAVIFAATPIWSALMAIPLGERFGLRGIIGAGLIVFATLLSSMKKRSVENDDPIMNTTNNMKLKQANA